MASSNVVKSSLPHLAADGHRFIEGALQVSEMTVRGDMIFVDDNGRLDAASYPEIISQAIAAQEGFRKLGNSNPQQEGFLLGVKKLEILGQAHVGDTLRISVYKAAKYGDFGIIDGAVYKGEELIARGEIKVWQSAGKAAA